MSKVVKAVTDSVIDTGKGEVISTEELKRRIDDSNKNRKNKVSREHHGRKNKTTPIQNSDLCVFSMDVTALYPSINVDMATQAVKDSMKTSKLEWRNVNTQQLIRYVSICCDREDIIKDKLGEVIPISKPRTTLNSLARPSKKVRES